MVVVASGGGAPPLSIQEGMSSIDRVAGFRRCKPFGERDRERERDRDRERDRERERERELDLDTIELTLDLGLGLCVTATTTGSFVVVLDNVLPSTFICCPNNAVPVNTLCAYNTLSGPSNSTKA